MKKLLILGGSRYILPVIEAAHELDCYVITADYLPHNVAHAHSDQYVNVSIVEEDAVLEIADGLRIDGVMSFAADPGVVTASYVAEKLGLPFQGSYETVKVLQNKMLFRAFLRDNGFNCPWSASYGSVAAAVRDACNISYPVIVKPTDAAGSKGVSRVEAPEQIANAVEQALRYSRCGEVIIEEFLEKQGDPSDSDGFVIDGRFECVSFTSQLFDEECNNPYAPAAYCMPSSMPLDKQKIICDDLQRVASLLHLGTGIFNIETRVAKNGNPYLMELSPRGGGNRLAEMLRYASGVDLVTASVQAALGLSITGVSQPSYNGFWYQSIFHSRRNGIFNGVSFEPSIEKDHLVETQLWISEGNEVGDFSSASNAFGTALMRFETEEELRCVRENADSVIRIDVK